MGQQQRSAVNEPRCGRPNVISGSSRANAVLSHDTKNFVCGLIISSADLFALHLFPLRSMQSDSTRRRDVFGIRPGLLAKDFPPQIICASIGWLGNGGRVPVDAAFLSWPRHTSVHLNILHTDVRSPLILAVQPGPDSTVLSAQPSHLLSITPQTNWTVTPLSGPRLHFSSHPSLPKTLFLLHCDIFDSPLPRICAAFPGSTPSSLFGRPSLPFARAASFLGIKSHPALMSARTSHLRSGCKAPPSTRATTLN